MEVGSLHRKISKQIQKYPENSHREIAEKLYREVNKAEWMELLTEEVRARNRGVTRDEEKKAFSSKLSGEAALFDIENMVEEDAEELFRSKFALGGNKYISWGDATVGHHQERIAFLSKLRDGINDSIERHEKAIETIKKHKVKCLSEIKK